MSRQDDKVILNINGYKFKKARFDKGDDVIFCQGSNRDAVCYSFSLKVMEELVNKVKSDPELQKQFGIKL